MASAVGFQVETGITNLSPLKLNGPLSNEQFYMADQGQLTPKARKPYTISKQRERWTEEEHKKFIEALQLYGRAWRRIEEHVGTKTAVQIRSHAQKFFSKVTRDANDVGFGNVKTIEIPPPRPKKKPSHPYPRKQVHSSTKEFSVLGKPGNPSSMVLPSPEEENGSPTSVLSMAGSESTGLLFSNKSSGDTSPLEFPSQSNDQEHGIPSSTISVDRDDTHLKLGLPHTGQIFEDSYPMGLCMMSEEQIQLKEPPAEEPTIPTLKLFGRTVVVSDCSKKSPARPDAVVHNSALEIADENHGNVMNLDMGLPTEEGLTQNRGNGGFPSCGVCPGGLLPMFYCLPSPLGDTSSHDQFVPLPFWGFFGNLQLPYACLQPPFGSREDFLQPNMVQNSAP
ncbi:hypothetical protein HPP92_022354 [Vanilla planifolia]|uniref:Uncharacterized protein n=1 Tax=Vanilla planifolia TaxID=51239 RepID=A0A835PVI6_VANPL|nr:hypothetical protein HPP92_022354 [Vanilla planifolia]